MKMTQDLTYSLIPDQVMKEKGMPPIGIVMWALGRSSHSHSFDTIKNGLEYFLRLGKYSVLADGGWGGPPGPWLFHWNAKHNLWTFGGYYAG